MAAGESVIRLALVRRGADGRETELESTVSAISPFSMARSRATAIAAAAPMIPRRLRVLAERGRPARAPRVRDATASASATPPRSSAGTLATAAALTRFARAAAARALVHSVVEEYHWTIAIAPRVGGAGMAETLREGAFRMLAPPGRSFIADPFLFEHPSGEHLFMELFPYATRRGVIAASRVDERGDVGPPRVVLERPYHLSYPLVLEWRGELFMIPETVGHRTVELYRCERFPDRWTLDATLLADLAAADATVIEHDGCLWMFVCVAPPGLLLHTELHLYSADDLRGPWRPHPLNPVVSDVRRARPAGRPWMEDGRWIRPGQDSSVRYGYGLTLARIDVLTREDYAEEPIAHVAPEALPWARGARGLHTWNASRRFCVTDVSVRRLRR
jgi:hypothetical protein